MATHVPDQVLIAIQNGQFDKIAGLLDRLELESANPNVLEQWPHSLHVLGHIYNKDLTDARFLWKRIPSEAKDNNLELAAVWKLLQYSWNKHYIGVWQSLQAFPWSPLSQQLVDAITTCTRADMLKLLSRAYSTITPAKAAELLGLVETEVTAVCTAHGWQMDAAAGVLLPPPTLPSQPVKEVLELPTLDLSHLTEYMLHLES